jgi:non-heme chloroperoxidase
MLKMARRSSKPIAVAWLCVLLWGSASSAAASPAPSKDKNPYSQSGFVTSWDGAKIHYIEAGRSKVPVGNAEERDPVPPPVTPMKGSATVTGPHEVPSILFVPGFTMPAWIWEKQIVHFSAKYHVVAMDLRSQGESAKTGEGDYPAAHARDMKAVIEQLRLAPVVLVGWSMGVPEIAAYVDLFGTSALAGIILVDGVPALDLTPEYIKGSIEFLKGMQANRAQMTDGFVRSMFRKPQTEEYLQKLIKGSLATPTDSAVAIGLATFTSDSRPAIAKINKPTLIVGATKDLVPQFQEMQKSIPGARFELFEDAGHALFVDDADKFNNLLDEFLTSLK